MAGLELLFSYVKETLKSRSDLLICCIHWNVISSGFKCVGVTEKLSKDEDPCPAEMLPHGWNENQDVYTLVYCPANSTNACQNVHTIKAVLMDNFLLIHFMKNSTEKVADITISLDDYTNADFSTFGRAFKKLDELQQRFKSEVLDNVLNCTRPTTSTESKKESCNNSYTHKPNPQRTPLQVEPRRPMNPVPDWGFPDDPLHIGASDLDPFSVGARGGMIFDPMRAGHRGIPTPGLGGQPSPPGAIPPGARFDPYGPPDVHPSGAFNHRARPPDPDMPQPPDYDDMFM